MNNLFKDFENILNIGEIPTVHNEGYTYLEQVLLLRKWCVQLKAYCDALKEKNDEQDAELKILNSYEHITRLGEVTDIYLKNLTNGVYYSTNSVNLHGAKDSDLIELKTGSIMLVSNDYTFESLGDASITFIALNTGTQQIAYGIYTKNADETETSDFKDISLSNIYDTIYNNEFFEKIYKNDGESIYLSDLNRGAYIISITSGNENSKVHLFPTSDSEDGIPLYQNDTLIVEYAEDDNYYIKSSVIFKQNVANVFISRKSKTDGYITGIFNKYTLSNPYTLPIASSTTLGGIKVGNNLSITPDGVLNATGGGGGTGTADYYFEYTNNYGYNDTSASTLELFNNIYQDVKNNKSPIIKVLKKGVTSLTNIYYLAIPFISGSQMILKGSPVYTSTRASYLYWTELMLTADISNENITKVSETIKYGTGSGLFIMENYSAKDFSTYTSQGSFALAVDNTTAYTPTEDYHPATKKYVDEHSGGGGGSSLPSFVIYDGGTTPNTDVINMLNAYYDYIETEGNPYLPLFYTNTPITSAPQKMYMASTIPNRTTTDAFIYFQLINAFDNPNNMTTSPYYKTILMKLKFATNRKIISVEYPALHGNVDNNLALLYKNYGTSNNNGALGVNNTDAYTPTADYHPATKIYVDNSKAKRFSFDFIFSDDSFEKNQYKTVSKAIPVSKSVNVNEIYGSLMIEYETNIGGVTAHTIQPLSQTVLNNIFETVTEVTYQFSVSDNGSQNLILTFNGTNSDTGWYSKANYKIKNIFINGYYMDATEDVSQSVNITKA